MSLLNIRLTLVMRDFPPTNKLVSSAKIIKEAVSVQFEVHLFEVPVFWLYTRSLMLIKNSKGSRTDPWGTPSTISSKSDLTSPLNTH